MKKEEKKESKTQYSILEELFRQQDTDEPYIRISLFWFVTLLLEYPFVFYLVYGDSSFLETRFVSVLAMHVMAALTMFFSYPKGRGWFHAERKWPRTFFFIVLFFPFFGALISIVVFLFNEKHPDPNEIFDGDEDFFHKTEDNILLPKDTRTREEKIMQATDIMPLRDVMASADVELKRGAIDKLAQFASQEAIQVLLEHRRDPSSEVRFFISTALTRIKTNLDERLESSKQYLRKNVHDMDSYFVLAQNYYHIAMSQLLDVVTQKKYLNEAKYNLEKTLLSDKVALRVCELLLNVSTAQNDEQSILKVLDVMEKNELVSVQTILKKRCDVYFQQKDFLAFVNCLELLAKEKNIATDWQAMLNWWGFYQHKA